jgi:hypothetical protein
MKLDKNCSILAIVVQDTYDYGVLNTFTAYNGPMLPGPRIYSSLT